MTRPTFDFPAWYVRMGFSRGARGIEGDYARVAELLGVRRDHVGYLVRGVRQPGPTLTKACQSMEREMSQTEAKKLIVELDAGLSREEIDRIRADLSAMDGIQTAKIMMSLPEIIADCYERGAAEMAAGEVK